MESPPRGTLHVSLSIRIGAKRKSALTRADEDHFRPGPSSGARGVHVMSFIITADDDPIFRGLLTATLEGAGHIVVPSPMVNRPAPRSS